MAQVHMLERGELYFLYRPRVETPGAEEPVQGLGMVQRFHLVLHPQSGRTFRLLTIGHKELPSVESPTRQPFWGLVDRVTSHAEEMRNELSGGRYETKTRGEREQPETRPAGEGVYAIVKHGDHTHLAYELELPRHPQKVQEIFHIEEEAGYILSIKNPEHGTDPRFAHLAEQRKPQYPPDLRQRLQGHSFVPADPPTFLDYEGTQFLLISATEDVQKELGIELDAEQESLESADLFSDLKLARSERTVEPLIQGEWA